MKFAKRHGWKLSVVALILLGFGFISQIDLTTQVKGILPEANGGTHQSTYTLGDVLYASATNTLSKLPGNTTATKNFLSQTGNATISAAPVWGAIVAADVPSLDAGKITTGTMATARLGSGTANSGVFLRGDSTWAATPAAPNFADAETPSGTIDGSNAIFTLAATPNPSGSLQLYKNGQLMKAGGADYTLATATATFVTGAKPVTGDVLLAFYRD